MAGFAQRCVLEAVEVLGCQHRQALQGLRLARFVAPLLLFPNAHQDSKDAQVDHRPPACVPVSSSATITTCCGGLMQGGHDAGLIEECSAAVPGATAAVLVAARGALVSSKLDRERKEFEEEQRLASPGRRGFVVATATGLAGAALGVSTLLSGREGGIDLTALKQAKPQVVVAKAPLKPSAVERKVSEAQARAEAAESRAAAAEANSLATSNLWLLSSSSTQPPGRQTLLIVVVAWVDEAL